MEASEIKSVIAATAMVRALQAVVKKYKLDEKETIATFEKEFAKAVNDGTSFFTGVIERKK